MPNKTPSLLHGAVSIIRLVLGGVFLWSSASKFRQIYDYLSSVYDYELVGPGLGLILAASIPWIECAIGVSLIAGVLERGALLLSLLLLALFALAQFSVLSRGLQVACGCFGKSHAPITPGDAFRTLLMLAAAIFALTCSLARSVTAQPEGGGTTAAQQPATGSG